MVVFVGIYSEAPVNEIAIYDSETNHVETRTLCQSIPYVVNGLNAEFGNELKQISVIFADNERRISEEIKKIPKVHVIQKEKSCFNGYSSAILDMGAQILEFTMNAGLINCFLYIISSSHSGIKGVKPVKTYETYCADDGLKTIADHVFGLKEGEAHLVFQFSDISQTEKESMIQKIEQDKEYFASTTMNQEELDTKDHYKAMIYSRFLSGDEQVKTLIKTDPNYFVDNAYDKGVNKLNTDRNERSKYKSRIITRPQFIDSYGSQTKLMGIDLGATRSVVCVSRNGSTELVKIDQENAMPTYISFAEDEPIVGSVAMRKLNYEPKSVLFDIKRTTDLSPRQFEKCWPFGICKTSETISFVVHSKTEIKEHSLVDVYKILVQKLKAKASEFQFDLNQGEPVNQAVFTVPFLDEGPAGHGMVSSIIKAANECGIKVIDIIEETHADFVYFLTKYNIPPNHSVFLIDFGGSTAIVREYYCVQEPNGKVIRNNFNMPFKETSGRKIDEMLMLKLQELLLKKHNIRAEHLNQYKWLSKVEKLKCDLSASDKAYLEWPNIDKPIEIKREWFTETILKRVLAPPKDNDFHEKPVYKVFLVGGGLRIPYFQQHFAAFFGPNKIVVPDELEHITATGALIHGLQVLSGEIEPWFDKSRLQKQEIKLEKPGNSSKNGLKNVDSSNENKKPSEVEVKSQLAVEKQLLPDNK